MPAANGSAPSRCRNLWASGFLLSAELGAHGCLVFERAAGGGLPHLPPPWSGQTGRSGRGFQSHPAGIPLAGASRSNPWVLAMANFSSSKGSSARTRGKLLR